MFVAASILSAGRSSVTAANKQCGFSQIERTLIHALSFIGKKTLKLNRQQVGKWQSFFMGK
jgi:hypothetical protein